MIPSAPLVRREQEALTNVAAGTTATLRLPVTKAYAAVYLEIRDTNGLMTAADIRTNIENITLRLSGGFGTQDFWDLSGARLWRLNDFYGVDQPDGVLPLVFAMPYWNAPQASDFFALGTMDLTAAQIDVKIASGVTGPQITAYALEYANNVPLGRFVKLAENVINATTTGKFEEPNLPVTGSGVGLKALHFDTANINSVEVRANGNIIYEDIPSLRPLFNSFNSFRTSGRNHQAGYTHMDFAGNRLDGVLSMTGVQDFRVEFDIATAGAFTCLSETIVGRTVQEG